MMKYFIDIPYYNILSYLDQFDWLDHEIGEGQWAWNPNDQTDIDRYYFKSEEDKVKFILKWL